MEQPQKPMNDKEESIYFIIAGILFSIVTFFFFPIIIFLTKIVLYGCGATLIIGGIYQLIKPLKNKKNEEPNHPTI